MAKTPRRDRPGRHDRATFVTHDQHHVHADQSDVWSRVARYESALGRSESSSLVEMTDRLEDRSREVLSALQVLPGQRGVLVGIGGHPALLEVFDHPTTFARQWAGIVTGVLADAALVPAAPTSGRRARLFAARASGRELRPVADAGSGLAVQARDDLVVIDAVVTQQRQLVHLSVLNARHELVGAA